MKRSAVNWAIAWAKDYLHKNNIHLPEYAYWPLETWKANAGKLDTVRKVMLGWDITDYGLNDFEHIGSVLYTVRNGSINDKSVGVPFCEKYIVMTRRPAPHQPLPRGQDGGHHQPRRRRAAPLPVEGGPRHGQDDSTTDVDVYMDGVAAHLQARRTKCWWSRATASR